MINSHFYEKFRNFIIIIVIINVNNPTIMTESICETQLEPLENPILLGNGIIKIPKMPPYP
tara:strand:- start:252 stop:434 length:183 start_codon:yes stop_codon:yes gene_type:complete